MNYETDQEKFWAGEFGNEYSDRNKGKDLVSSNIGFFTRIFEKTTRIETVIEFGANVGMNLTAIGKLLPDAELSAIEINTQAVKELEGIERVKIYHQSLLDFIPDYSRDLVLIKGVLIHLNPECLPRAYELLFQTSARYICLAEYYNPTPVEVSYRGHSDRLYKRDFAGEMMDRFRDLVLVDYGFAYHRDKHFPQDDITWFLMEKT